MVDNLAEMDLDNILPDELDWLDDEPAPDDEESMALSAVAACRTEDL